MSTTDGRELLLVLRTEFTTGVQLLLHQLDLTLPPQSPPTITAPLKIAKAAQAM